MKTLIHNLSPTLLPSLPPFFSLSLSSSLSPSTDRVVDELQPERHFTADEIITLLRPLANLPEPQDLSFGASLFRNDQVLFILCQHFGPLLTKVRGLSLSHEKSCYVHSKNYTHVHGKAKTYTLSSQYKKPDCPWWDSKCILGRCSTMYMYSARDSLKTQLLSFSSLSDTNLCCLTLLMRG